MRKFRFFTIALFVLTFVTASARAQFSVLYNFVPGGPEGPTNSGIIAQGRDGNLYSTAMGGGAIGFGAAFKITPAGALTTLYSFTNGTDGQFPESGLTLGTDGNFYGTTLTGTSTAYGTVFKITITPSVKLTTLHTFTFGDGAYPTAPPIQGTDGNLYGTTSGGGNPELGTIYKITLPSGTLTLLYQFDNTHGASPYDPLVQGSDGNFYGTTFSGGKLGYGVIFKMTAAGKLTVLYNFDGTHGAHPYDPLVQGSDGNFYGTTSSGGTSNGGVVFKITPTGSLTVLHNMNGTTDGSGPTAGLVQATDGNFYGVNEFSTSGYGNIFKITPKGSYSVLYTFDSTTGAFPLVTPFQDTNGIVYGDTVTGGSPGFGVFYRLNLRLAPFVTFLPPQSSGKVGKTIEFFGQGFKSSTTVSFYGGIAATPKVISGTYLTAAVPNGALTGVVTVTTSGVTLKSNKIFRVIPQILSFKPTSGPVGTVVTITGVSLKQTTRVTFGGVKATTVTVVSDTQVKATVPAGAKTGHIAVTTLGGTAVSSGIFMVT